MKHILIVTNSGDIHSDDLVRACERKGVGCFRYNTDHVRTRGIIESHVGTSTRISVDSRSIDIHDVGLLIYRRPLDVTPEMLGFEIEPWALSFINQEWNWFERSLPELIGCKTINHPAANQLAQNKLVQLAVARSCGLAIPETLVSNDGSTLSHFAAQRPSITKAIGNGSHLYAGQIRSGCTHRANAESFPKHLNPFTIGLVQSEIIPAAMWRVVTIGSRCFGFRLTGKPLRDEVDSRRVEDMLEGGPALVPGDVCDGLLTMMRRFGILYASSDFIEDKAGRLWLIDLNPEGQWGSYEQRFGVPISEHIIEEIET